MSKLEVAARQALEACEAGKKIAKLMVQLSVKLGHGDLAAEFLEDGIFERTDAALREALDQHKPHEECECSACLNYFTDKAHEEALAEQDSMKECRHCGFLCKPNDNKSRKWYPLEQAEPVAWESFGKAYEKACKSSNPKDWMEAALLAQQIRTAPVRTKDLTDDEVQKLWYDTSSIVPMWAHHLHFARAVIAADREKNNV